jgi:hypothetical protein
MSNETISREKTIIKLWKELEITSIDFKFSCGGDSMNETEIEIYTKNGVIQNSEIEDYFDNEVYKNVSFYEASDGHYIGESGVVEINLENEDDEDECSFSYSKSAQAEFSENFTENVDVELTDKEVEFINANIINFNGEETNVNVVYKDDIFLTDEDELLVNDLLKKIDDTISNYTPNDYEGELQDYYTFNTKEDNLTIEDNLLTFEVNFNAYVYRDSED